MNHGEPASFLNCKFFASEPLSQDQVDTENKHLQYMQHNEF